MATYTENLIPIMTSNNTPKGIASSSSIFQVSYDPWRAFDNILFEDVYNANYWGANNLPQWISYEFETKVVISKYTMKAVSTVSNRMPKAWTFEGTNDNVDWDVLDKHTGIIWGEKEKKEFTFNNNKYYKKYRIYVTEIGSGITVSIDKIEMMSQLEHNKYLVKQGNEYIGIKSELYKQLGQPIDDAQCDNWFENYGTDDLSVFTTEYNKKAFDGIDKGTLGTGKYFEFSLKDDIKTIKSIE